MLRQGGAQVRVAGFRRGQGALPEPATVLGRTSNGRMIQRVRAIAEGGLSPLVEALPMSEGKGDLNSTCLSAASSTRTPAVMARVCTCMV